eukprot:7276105-Pyramimonas_sp.AAC.1
MRLCVSCLRERTTVVGSEADYIRAPDFKPHGLVVGIKGRCINTWVFCVASQLLDSTERQVEDNLGSTKQAVCLAKEQYSRASRGSCYRWLILLAVGFIFMGMVVFIRLYSDKVRLAV